MEKKQLEILLLEDNNADADYIKHLLKKTDINPTLVRAHNFSEALNLFDSHHFDLILLDLNVTDRDKDEMVAELNTLTDQYPILVLSGLKDEKLKLETIKAGAQDYLVKGDFDEKLLTRCITYAYERHNLRQKNQYIANELSKKKQELIEAQAIAQIGHWWLNPFTMEMKWSYEAINVLDIEMAGNTMQFEDFLDLVFEKDQAKIREYYRLAIEDNNDFNVDVRIKQPHKKFQHINIRIRSNKEKDLEFKQIKGTIQDITLRKETERALKRSEEKYHALFDQSKDAIYITTREGKFIDFNKAALDLFGYNEKQMRNLNVESIYLNPFERVKFKKAIDEYGFVKDFETKLKRSNGEKIDCIITSSKWESNNKKLLGFQGIIRDITEIKINAELRKQKEIIESSSKLKEQFLANMSHEIRTPINGISGLTHLLSKTDLEPKQLDYLSGIKASSEHLLALINDILDFSKIEAGKITFKSETFNLKDAISQLLMPLAIKAEERNNEIVFVLDEKLPKFLVGDSVRLKQILINLIGNAIKFTENGKVSLEIKQIEATTDATVVSFTISDTGIGIEDEKLESIFTSFTQLAQDLNKITEGTGLGLTITKQLIDLQGGTIKVKSKLDAGSEFNVVLKFRNQLKSFEEKKQEELFEVTNIGYKRILLLEDKKLNQLVVNELMMRWWPDIKIDIAENGKIGVDFFEHNSYDLVLMDVQMPIMDGYEATRIIRNRFDPPESEVPILAMTAYATTGEAEKCLDAGMNDYISKPFEPKQFYNKVVELISSGGERKKLINTIFEDDIKTMESFEKEEIDLSSLDKITGGNINLKQQIVNLIINDTPEEVEVLINAITEKNWKKVKSLAHKLKSSVSYLGMNNTLNIVKRIEEYAGEEKNLDTIPSMVNQVNESIEEAVETLKTLELE